MKSILKILGGVMLSVLPALAQSTLILRGPSDAPLGSFAASDPEASSTGKGSREAPTNQSLPNPAFRLSVKDAEAIALKNNPAISVARLSAMASHEVTREVRSNLWPQSF
jgi:hypothetical protein